jgi:hypothetical protein
MVRFIRGVVVDLGRGEITKVFMAVRLMVCTLLYQREMN